MQTSGQWVVARHCLLPSPPHTTYSRLPTPTTFYPLATTYSFGAEGDWKGSFRNELHEAMINAQSWILFSTTPSRNIFMFSFCYSQASFGLTRDFAIWYAAQKPGAEGIEFKRSTDFLNHFDSHANQAPIWEEGGRGQAFKDVSQQKKSFCLFALLCRRRMCFSSSWESLWTLLRRTV